MLKKLVLTTVGLLIVVGVLAGTKFMQFRAMAASGAAMVMPPETVTAAPVREEEWENRFTATGSITAVQGVTIAGEMGGKVAAIDFESGATVQAGDLLVRLDTSAEEAQLRATEAAAVLAQINLERARDLRAKGTNAPADFDIADAQAKQAAAQVDGIRAAIAKKMIRAPFAGRLGLRLINLGQIVREGEPITTLQTLDPIYVNFSLPQQRLSALATGTTVRVTTDAVSGAVFEGKINALNSEVDTVTRNVRVQATIANPEEKLWSGMFANVEIVLPTKEKVLIVPITAVQYAPYGDSVFIVEEKKNEKSGQMEKMLRQQFVRLGSARGDFVTVVDGLKSGEVVVTSGGFKLRSGATVVIDNTLAPNAQIEPKPDNA